MLAFTLAAALAAHPWPTFRNGPANGGASAVALRPWLARPSGREPARFATGGLVWGTPVVGADGTAYVGSADKQVYALALTPKGYVARWQHALFDQPDALVDSACALGPAGLLVVPGGDGFLHGLDRETGRVRWTFRSHVPEAEQRRGVTVGSFEGNVQVGPDGTFYAGCDDGAMYAVAPDGTQRWRLQTGMMVWSSPALAPDGSWLAFGSLDGHVYLVEAATGRVLDKFAAGAEVKSSPMLDARGRLVVGTSAGQVLALEVVGGKLRPAWRFEAGAEVYASPASWQDLAIVGALDGRIHALDLEGRERWSYRTRGRVAASAAVSADGVALVGASDGTLYALDAASGERIWSYHVTASRLRANLDASPALGPDGWIHVGSYDGGIYAVPAEWPLAHRDDPRVATGGTADAPDWGPPAATATLRVQDALGEYRAAPKGALGLGETLRLRLVAPGDDEARTRFALNPGGLAVETTPAVPVEVRLSSDGRFVNLTPKGLWPAATDLQVRVKGSYRTRDGNWLLDRYLPFREARPFAAELACHTAAAGPSVRPGPLAWAASRLYLSQPAALDTYTPAALDGQATVLVAPAGAGPDGRLAVLGLPALPGPAGPKVLAEPSKVFMLEGRAAEGWLRVRGAFRLAAMGGDIGFETFEAAAPLHADGTLADGEFVAVAPLLGIRGSGAAYGFPAALLNEVADHALRVVAVGAFQGGAPAPDAGPPRLAGLRRTAEGVALRLETPVAGEHLLAALAITPEGDPAGVAAARVEAGRSGELALRWERGRPTPGSGIYLVWDARPVGVVP